MLPLHRQPWKTLYLFCIVASLMVKLPFWTLRAVLFPSSRPNKSWTAKKTVWLYVARLLISLLSTLQLGLFPNNAYIPDGTYKNTKFVWIEGEREENIQGQIKEFVKRAGVKPLKTSAFWYYRSGTLTSTIEEAKVGENVIYYIHGGAFFHGTAHPKGPYASIPKGILRNSKSLTRILALDYHLSSSAPLEQKHSFPTAILDIIAGYRYLLGLGFSSENIILASDSAGGNLALAFIRYLKETAQLPVPGRMILLSPWGDISASNNGPTSSFQQNKLTDIFGYTGSILQEKFAGYGIRSYLGSTFDFEKDAKTNPYFSPTSLHIKPSPGEYRGYPKSLIISGSMELIMDESIIMANYLRKDNPDPNHVRVHIANAAVHDFLLFPWAEPESTETLLRIAQWLEE